MAVTTPNTCLFCGTALTEENRTQEHVFPRWLQSRFDLGGKTIALADNTD